LRFCIILLLPMIIGSGSSICLPTKNYAKGSAISHPTQGLFPESVQLGR
jgi:hypothetical protein